MALLAMPKSIPTKVQRSLDLCNLCKESMKSGQRVLLKTVNGAAIKEDADTDPHSV